MSTLTYEELVSRFGQVGAYDLLLKIEQQAKTKLQDSSIHLDEETRLQKALDVIDEKASAV